MEPPPPPAPRPPVNGDEEDQQPRPMDLDSPPPVASPPPPAATDTAAAAPSTGNHGFAAPGSSPWPSQQPTAPLASSFLTAPTPDAPPAGMPAPPPTSYAPGPATAQTQPSAPSMQEAAHPPVAGPPTAGPPLSALESTKSPLPPASTSTVPAMLPPSIPPAAPAPVTQQATVANGVDATLTAVDTLPQKPASVPPLNGNSTEPTSAPPAPFGTMPPKPAPAITSQVPSVAPPPVAAPLAPPSAESGTMPSLKAPPPAAAPTKLPPEPLPSGSSPQPPISAAPVAQVASVQQPPPQTQHSPLPMALTSAGGPPAAATSGAAAAAAIHHPTQGPPPGHPQLGPPAHQTPQTAAMAAGMPPPGHSPVGMPPPGQPHAAQQGSMRELRVEDALLYLDDVKREFKDRPHIYNEFLSIMKNFKTQAVDTPGVIDRVSRLFRGYNNLILGFNTFLPDGYKISLEDLKRQEEMIAAQEQTEMEQQMQQQMQQSIGPGGMARRQPPAGAGPQPLQTASWTDDRVPPAAATSSPYAMATHQPQQQHAPPQRPPAAKGPPPPPSQQQQQQPMRQAVAQTAAAPPPPPPPPQQHQAVEFDHAISYVTKIKRRFSNDPSIYHSFLEILHNYQREQRGIKEVLEQVAHLFQDHPDLLKEFTFFLPDAVQEQAKERLHRAAAESELRQLTLRQKQQFEQFDRDQQPQKFIDMTARIPEGGKRMLEEEPESYVYNSAVERQFFDATKEALTAYSRDGGQAWAEFLKCLDMYAQDILSRNEMLNFVEPLLGKRHTKLFEEFKRILTAAGTPTGLTPPTEESWYSVPLAEIDFCRCRRCSPSYRALPRDYPSHPCSDRSPEEAKVLNDVWVSLPVGSEESYTFRHMRRNTYEETLFRVEDERFEIDMVIDSNAATLQRLMPVAEEIAMLAREDVLAPDATKSTTEIAGMGGKRFQYSFDKNILGVIHRNVIARIYGDAGQEMLDLMVKNPTVAIPLVVQRLRQKDREFRAARDRLNRHWRELAEQNYYKSLDHRGLTWRTIDKRATSTRTMIVEIKDRAANGGKEGSEALRQRLEKAKEEHGTFFEVTMGRMLCQDLDLTFLPKPDRRIFTPHISLMYENNSWAQRDAYRILSFALERGPISPADKDRCHRLWVEFLGPWFDLSQNWMQKPAVTYQETRSTTSDVPPTPMASVVSEDDEEESMEEDRAIEGRVVTEELRQNETSKEKMFSDYHPLPPECTVSTLYGEGKILEFRRSDHIYVVQLPFGKGYLRPATVLCSTLPVEKSAYTEKLRETDRTKLARPSDQLAFGTQSLYLFFRLHQILIQRLNTAKRLAYSVDDDTSLITLIEQMPHSNRNAQGRRRYEAYLSLLYALLDGGVGAAEGGKYEDRVRSLLGHGGYELATMDKLISHIWKNLQAMANDETMWNLVQLYRRHATAGSFQPEAFRQEAAFLADGEAMYAFQHCFLTGKDDSVIYMEHVGVMEEEGIIREPESPMEVDDTEGVEPASKRQKR